MFRLYLIDCYDVAVQFKDLQYIDLNKGGITYIEIKMSLNEPYQMKMNINANFPYWSELKNNKNYGIRVETDYVNLAFVQLDRKQSLFGSQEFLFVSSSYKLSKSQLLKRDTSYNGSLATWLSGINTDVVFTPISPDKDITFETGILDNLKIVNDSINQSDFFSWRDNGIKNVGGVYKTEILYGNFGSDINTWYNASPNDRKMAKGVRYLQGSGFDNFLDTESATIEYVNENDSGDIITYLFAVGDNGQGVAENAGIRLTNPNASYIDPQYPLIPITNSFKGTIDYYIFNPFVKVFPPLFRYESFTLTTNTQESGGNVTLTREDAERKVYNLGRALLQRTNRNRVTTFNVTNKRLVLPGNTAFIQYKEFIPEIGQKSKGITTFDLNETKVLDNLTFDLNIISN